MVFAEEEAEVRALLEQLDNILLSAEEQHKRLMVALEKLKAVKSALSVIRKGGLDQAYREMVDDMVSELEELRALKESLSDSSYCQKNNGI